MRFLLEFGLFDRSGIFVLDLSRCVFALFIFWIEFCMSILNSKCYFNKHNSVIQESLSLDMLSWIILTMLMLF